MTIWKSMKTAFVAALIGVSAISAVSPAFAYDWREDYERNQRMNREIYQQEREAQDRRIRELGGNPHDRGVSVGAAVAVTGAFLLATWLFSKNSSQTQKPQQ